MFRKLFVMYFLNNFQENGANDSEPSNESSQRKKVGADPFNNEECDPTKSGAMRK